MGIVARSVPRYCSLASASVNPRWGATIIRVTDNVGRRLLALRKAAELTQQQLAVLVNERHDLGWYQSTVQKNEAGTRPLTLTDLEALADVFGMRLDAMLYGEDWPGVESHHELPYEDPIHEMRWERQAGAINALMYERQQHVLRLAEIDTEVSRLQSELHDYPGDAENEQSGR